MTTIIFERQCENAMTCSRNGRFERIAWRLKTTTSAKESQGLVRLRIGIYKRISIKQSPASHFPAFKVGLADKLNSFLRPWLDHAFEGHWPAIIIARVNGRQSTLLTLSTYLTKPDVNSRRGTISSPFSSLALMTSNVAMMLAARKKILMSAKCFPGHKLIEVRYLSGLHNNVSDDIPTTKSKDDVFRIDCFIVRVIQEPLWAEYICIRIHI